MRQEELIRSLPYFSNMNRYFLEVAYLGTSYAGFQIQENANTIQAEVEQAFLVYFREPVSLTGSSRTDAGVHARQNYFHFDWPHPIDRQSMYNLNALLPPDIAIRDIFPVAASAHCRFDALSREYEYHVYQRKDPFALGRAYYYPYAMQESALQEAAALIKGYTDFASFSKRGSQTRGTECQILESGWHFREETLVYRVKANRFLRGMVRGLVGTMLQVGRGKIDLIEFQNIIISKNPARADFSVPGAGLYLMEVRFGQSIEAKAGEF